MTSDDFCLCIDGKITVAVRVPLGLVTNFADEYDCAQFAMDLETVFEKREQ